MVTVHQSPIDMLDWNIQLIRGTSLDTYGKLRTAKSAITLTVVCIPPPEWTHARTMQATQLTISIGTISSSNALQLDILGSQKASEEHVR